MGTSATGTAFNAPIAAVGTALTAALTNDGTQSSDCGTDDSSCQWGAPATGDFVVGPNQPQLANLGPVSINGGGPAYAAGQLAFNSIGHNDAANNTNEFLNFSGSATSITNVSALAGITLGPPVQDNGSDWDMLGIWTVDGDYVMLQFNPSAGGSNTVAVNSLPQSCANQGGSYGVRLESGHNSAPYTSTLHSGYWNSSGTWIAQYVALCAQSTQFYSMNYNMNTVSVDNGVSYGLGTLSVYSTDGTLIGTISVPSIIGGGLAKISIGNNEGGNNTGTFTYFQNVMLNWSNPTVPMFWGK